MKAFRFFLFLALLDAMTLGMFVARRDAIGVVVGVITILVLLILARRELRRHVDGERWTAAMLADRRQHRYGSSKTWPGGGR